jgi:hypothetical protein
MSRQGLRLTAILPALLVGGLKRPRERALKAWHVHDSMIGA